MDRTSVGMPALEYLAFLLQSYGGEVEDDVARNGRIFSAIIAGNSRVGALVSDGRALIQFLVFLQNLDALGKKGLRRFRSAVDSTALDGAFAGTLYPSRGVLWWKLEIIAVSDGEAMHEMFDALLSYVEADLFRIDMVRGLSIQHYRPCNIRRAVAALGDIRGFA